MAAPEEIVSRLTWRSWKMEGEPGDLTLLEMLDALELQVTELRARNRELTAALQVARDGKPSASTSKKPRKSIRKPKKARVAAKKVKPLVEPAQPEAIAKDRSILGKRQALGRSLVQLRRHGAVQEQNSSDSQSPSEELITRG